MTTSLNLVVASAEPSTQRRRSVGIALDAPLTRFRVRTHLRGLDPSNSAESPASREPCFHGAPRPFGVSPLKVVRPRPPALRSEILDVGLAVQFSGHGAG